MTDGSSYELVLAPPATRAIRSGLREAVAAAVVEFLTGALVENPRRVGKPLRGELAGIHSARRGPYRVLYRIKEETREVVFVRIEQDPGGDHRADTAQVHQLLPADYRVWGDNGRDGLVE